MVSMKAISTHLFTICRLCQGRFHKRSRTYIHRQLTTQLEFENDEFEFPLSSLSRHKYIFCQDLRCLCDKWQLIIVFVSHANNCPVFAVGSSLRINITHMSFVSPLFRSWHQIYSATQSSSSPFRSISLHAVEVEHEAAAMMAGKAGNSLGTCVPLIN